ncbi:twin-arginine translocation pathway signal protein, partial [Pseudomonas gingeri]|nr:twin-arginine translocation pathway signal protein [Pseudomonas gingeri]
MIPSLSESPALSRRGLLKIGLCASAFLTTAGLAASLGGCSASGPASGFAVLQTADLPFLRALIPVMLEGAVSADKM